MLNTNKPDHLQHSASANFSKHAHLFFASLIHRFLEATQGDLN